MTSTKELRLIERDRQAHLDAHGFTCVPPTRFAPRTERTTIDVAMLAALPKLIDDARKMGMTPVEAARLMLEHNTVWIRT